MGKNKKNKKEVSNRKKIIKAIIFAIVVGFLLLVTKVIYDNKKFYENVVDITYSEFLEKVEKKEITKAIINNDVDKFLIEDTNKAIYRTDNPKYAEFKKDLLTKGINVEVQHSIKISFSSIVLIISSIATIYFLYSLVEKSGLNKQSKLINKKVGEEVTTKNVTFKDVAGLTPVKKDMELLVDFMKNSQKYSSRGAEMPKGVIFYGDPGTGKTLMAKAIAGEANVPFYSASGSEFVELFVGQGAKRVRELFEKAKANSPCIIFIDEIDAIGKARNVAQGSDSEREQTLNQLLTEIDGFSNSSGILIIGATNRLDVLDPALLRTGRFDKHICISLPSTSEERVEILKMYAKDKKMAEDVDLLSIAKQTIGFSPSDLKGLLNEATLISIQLNKEIIDKECIDKAYFKKVLKGHEKEDSNRAKEELTLVAWHEAGHALTARVLGIEVPKVTVVQSTSGAGGVTFTTPKERSLLSKEELENSVIMSYGGRGAEEILLKDKNKVTTGASADIKNATQLIYRIISNYGMTEEFGLLDLSLMEVDNEVILRKAVELSNQLYARSLDILEKNKDKLSLIAETLIEKETISGEELEELINRNNVIEEKEPITI